MKASPKMKKGLRLFIGVGALLTLLMILSIGCSTKPQEGFTALNSELPGSFSDTEGLTLEQLGLYTGVFVEQGTDEQAENMLAVILANTGEKMLEKAVLTLQIDGEAATFIVTYLPAGASCLVQEHSARTGSKDSVCTEKRVKEISYVNQEAVTLYPDKLEIESSDGNITIRNSSGGDIPGSVNVWYKTVSEGRYFGGISYKAGVDHGVLLAGAEASIACSHYSTDGAEILLVTFSE